MKIALKDESSDEYDVSGVRSAVITLFYAGSADNAPTEAHIDAFISYILDELAELSRADPSNVAVGRFAWGEPPLTTPDQTAAAVAAREGPWLPALDVFGKEYWFHKETKEARWDRPTE